MDLNEGNGFGGKKRIHLEKGNGFNWRKWFESYAKSLNCIITWTRKLQCYHAVIELRSFEECQRVLKFIFWANNENRHFEKILKTGFIIGERNSFAEKVINIKGNGFGFEFSMRSMGLVLTSWVSIDYLRHFFVDEVEIIKRKLRIRPWI